jgi:hypothetical protein
MSHLEAQVNGLRLALRRRRLERQERAGFRRLGRELDGNRRDPVDSPELRLVLAEIGAARGEIEALVAEEGVTVEADRADLARVAFWAAPMVTCRGLCARVVLRHRRRSASRTLDLSYEALGRESARLRGGVTSIDVSRLPAWSGRAAEEAMGFGHALWQQLRSHLVPKAPAVAGLAVGWWIANTYTDSHLRSVLRTVGIGGGGTHVVSGSTYRAMSFWLPLLAAALCAYLGERLARSWGFKGVKGEG